MRSDVEVAAAIAQARTASEVLAVIAAAQRDAHAAGVREGLEKAARVCEDFGIDSRGTVAWDEGVQPLLDDVAKLIRALTPTNKVPNAAK